MKHQIPEPLSNAQREAIIQKAHQLRAEALRDIAVALASHLKAGFHKASAYIAHRYHDRAGIRFEATPALKR